MYTRILQKSIIPIVTIGSILEWYEIGLYIYWASLIEKVILDALDPLSELISMVAVILAGFIARPLGGFIFGRIGDRVGRKKAFALSIILVSVPTVLVGLTQSYEQWSLFSVIFLGLMKFIQGIPAGGEIPGAICFLAESSTKSNKHYALSYSFVGPQIGLLLSLVQCLLLQKFIPEHFLTQGMWRVSFLLCGFLGFLGYLLRNQLEESEGYRDLQTKKRIIKDPTKVLFKSHKKKLVLGFCVSIFQVVSFNLLTILPIFYLQKALDLSTNENLFFSSGGLFLCFIGPVIVGKLADKYKSFPFLRVSVIVAIVFALPFYYAIKNQLLLLTMLIRLFLIASYSIQAAFIPFILSNLFPIKVRYTGIGFSFNMCDGLFMGLVPMLSFFIIQGTKEVASYALIFPVIAVSFLISYHFTKKEIKENKKQNLI